ncbi:putative secreted protein (Por secretion system target) [Winogradskyella pacifica]|uniref:Putative secreted protein (Por secretion system target) n=1 Tax=Winogradskyella pacifica TaxID=664642 RepID=A0A3D9LPW3_9FLAO|nr:T9SS type A sorting domain-containing protein [Winogradskyella pacifica]REE08736.1 putative secreted protein (Por secretion system target) [Winogradskyella pacifica]
MKKQLLFTLAFLGAITFASAQTEIAFDAAGDDLQTFTVGQQGSDDLDEGIITVGGTGVLVSNNNFMGVRSDTPTDNGATGVWSFTIATTSTTAINATLNLDMAKRPGCSVSGTVAVSGYTNTSYSFGSDGTDVSAVIDAPIEFGSIISLVSGSPLTVTITLDEMLNVDNTATSIFRLENVILERNGSLSVEEISANSIVASVSPNPTANSFQINSNKSIESVKLYNITGRLVKTFGEEANYDISDLTTGIYIANIKTQLGSKTIKVVKE